MKRSMPAHASRLAAFLLATLLALPELRASPMTMGDLLVTTSDSLPVTADHLRIVWHDDEIAAAEGKAESRQVATDACDHLGSWLLAGQGPWGLGVFATFECFLGDTPVLSRSPSDSWTLHIMIKPDQWRLELRLGDQAETTEATSGDVVTALSMNASAQTPLILATDQLFAAALAAALLDAMPMAARLGDSHVARLPKPRGGKDADDRIPKSALVKRSLDPWAPKELKAYHLGYVAIDQLWKADVLGQAFPRPYRSESGAATSTWRLGPKAKRPGSEPIFAHRQEGRGQYVDRLLAAASKREKRLAAKLTSAARFADISLDKIHSNAQDLLDAVTRQNFPSGYVGLRVGRELVRPGETPLPAATLFGLLAEFRGGLLKGTRIYYDEVPRTYDRYDGEPLYLAYSRLVLGYGFTLQLPCPRGMGHCQAMLAPKVGLWSIDARLPIVTATGNAVATPLETRRASSIGYEVGLEVERLAGMARLWHARDTSLPALGDALPSSVTSLRFGIDGFLNGPSIEFFGRGWRWSYLLFAFLDVLEIKTSHSREASAAALARSGSDREQQQYLIGLSSVFAGAGVSTAW